LDKPLHVIYKISKVAYRIRVILIATKRVKKKEELYNFKEYTNLYGGT
jgi:hypothetical protein